MSLFGSLFSGVGGLAAQSRAMGAISDNVANVNTIAYKGAVTRFATLVTGDAGARNYSPGGVRALTGQTVGVQGLVQSTGSTTDAAISGAGFFVVNGKADGGGEQLYTRAGSFSPDYLGNLRTPSGHFLQGWALDADEQIADVNTLQTVNIRGVSGVATATTAIEVGANLDAGQAVHAGPYAGGDMAAHAASGGATGVKPNFTRAVQAYDSLGRSHDLTLAFLRNGPANAWAVEVYAAPGDVAPATHPNGLVASGAITFNGDGSLGAVTLNPVRPGAAGAAGIEWSAASGADPSEVGLDFGTIGQTDGLSQFASPTDVAFVRQNGAEVGELNGVGLDEEGYVIGSFTNGQQRRLYRLPVSTFANPGALEPRSGSAFAQTDASGEFNLRTAGSGGAGAIVPAALESANVDLADEFTRMIVTQRAYSANAKVITTTDQMLDDLIRISR